MQEPIRSGDWCYRIEADGSAVIVSWMGDVYDAGGVCVTVPEALDGHRVAALEGDVFGEERIAGMVDDGWLPPVSVESAPDSPARVWAAQHVSDYLYWNVTEGAGDCCRYHLLSDGTACLDAWWSGDDALELPGAIDGHPVTRLGEGAVSYAEASAIVVPEGVVSVGGGCFCRCEAASVTLPSTLRELGEGAFRECTELQELVLPEGVEAVAYALLKGCESLRRLELPPSVRELGGFALDGCGALQELELPGELTAIGGHAFSMTGLRTIELPAGVRTIDDLAFSWCKARVSAPEGTYAQRWLDEHPDRSWPL